VAYDIVSLTNGHEGIGAGVIGELEKPLAEKDFLSLLKRTFETGIIRHTGLDSGKISKVALCGGAGSFLIKAAINAGAQAFVTGDIKYHDFFEVDEKMMLADIGHFESERFTIDLLQEVLARKFPTFAVLKTALVTNPIRYFQ
jgi:putative NIF3 family GTP cyclohydrolase 1 type 2